MEPKTTETTTVTDGAFGAKVTVVDDGNGRQIIRVKAEKPNVIWKGGR